MVTADWDVTAVSNCIFWGNSNALGMAEDAQLKTYAWFTPPMDVNYCCIQNLTGQLGGVGNIGDDPLLVDADGPDDEVGTEDDNLRLSSGSPCIDTADNTAVPADEYDLDGDGDTAEAIPFDLDFNARFVDGDNDGDEDVDMGAYEFQGCPADLDGNGSVGPFDLALVLGFWGPNEGHPSDIDGDGVVGPLDLAYVLGNWGPCP